MRFMFSFFDADRNVTVINHNPVYIIYKVLKSTAQSIDALPPVKDTLYNKVLHKQIITSKRNYLKKHAKPINTYKLKGCRIRR